MSKDNSEQPKKYSKERVDKLSTEPNESYRSIQGEPKTNKANPKEYYTTESVQRPTKPKEK